MRPQRASSRWYQNWFSTDRSRRTTQKSSIAGVVLQPLTAHQWFGLSANALCNQAAALDTFWPRHSLRERLLEAQARAGVLLELERALIERVRDMEPASSLLYSAIQALELGQPVATVQAALDMSPRRLRAAFERELGVTPKRYSRIRRLQRVLSMLDRPDAPCACWARLAAGAGYADQAHLIREFKELVGVTPGSYRSRNPRDRNHIPLLSENTRS